MYPGSHASFADNIQFIINLPNLPAVGRADFAFIHSRNKSEIVAEREAPCLCLQNAEQAGKKYEKLL